MDILEAVSVTMPCGACSSEYELTLRQLVLSQQMLHEGCPVSDERECPPLYWSQIVDEQLARELQSIWKRLENRVHKAGGELKLLGKEHAFGTAR